MLTEERKQYIMDALHKQKIVKVQQLMKELKASESTIRRDLKELEEANLLKRIHGGARQKQSLNYEQTIQEKSAKNIQEKQKIAALAASFIQDEEVIYLDAGTTTFEMLPFLKGKNIQVVTNSIYHAARLADLHIPTHVLGGQIKVQTKAILGQFALQQLGRVCFDRAFIGTNGIHDEYGYTTPDPEEAALKTLAIEQSATSYILADQSKFGLVTFTQIAPLQKATILTDSCPDKWKKSIQTITTIKEVQA